MSAPGNDPRDVLASEALVIDWMSVFREEYGWRFHAGGTNTKFVYRDCRAGEVLVSPEKIRLSDGDVSISRQFPDATLGELLDIADELAATRFCGGWK